MPGGYLVANLWDKGSGVQMDKKMDFESDKSKVVQIESEMSSFLKTVKEQGVYEPFDPGPWKIGFETKTLVTLLFCS